MRHKKAIISLVLTTVLFLGSVAYAQGSWQTIPFDMTILPELAEPAFTMFNDLEATLPLIGIHWGQVNYGQHLSFVIYVKNTGDATGVAGIRVLEDTSSWLDWAVTPTPQTIDPGEVVTFSWEADVTAVVTEPSYKAAHFDCYEP